MTVNGSRLLQAAGVSIDYSSTVYRLRHCAAGDGDAAVQSLLT